MPDIPGYPTQPPGYPTAPANRPPRPPGGGSKWLLVLACILTGAGIVLGTVGFFVSRSAPTNVSVSATGMGELKPTGLPPFQPPVPGDGPGAPITETGTASTGGDTAATAGDLGSSSGGAMATTGADDLNFKVIPSTAGDGSDKVITVRPGGG